MSEASEVRKKHVPIYLVIIFGGAILILLSFLLKPKEPNVWWETVTAIGQAFIIGPTISWILDLPSMINYFKKITIQSLVSKEYLDSMERGKLIELRKECTGRIHLKDAQFIEPGLINIDESICELLTKHYHERYRQNVSCRIDGNHIIKKHHIEEVIINPVGGNGTIKIPENLKMFVYKNESEPVDDILKVLKYTVASDDKEEIDYIKQGMKIKETPSDVTDMTYNSQLTIVRKDNLPLEFEFSKNLKIEKIYEVRVPKTDNTFLKRLTIPVKSFRFDYHFPDSNVKLIGACFGTLSFSNEGNIKIIHESDHISIESYSWLLPGNGVFIVAS